MHPQRAQPPLESPGLPDQRVDGLPGLRRLHPVRERLPLRDPAGAGLQHLLRREVAPGPRGVDDRGRAVRPVAAGAWIRTLLRLPGRRHPPVLPRTGARQFADRTRDHTRAGLPPDPRPGGEGHRDDRRRQAGRAEQAVLPVLRTRCDAFTPPRAQGVGRPLRRQVRHRLGGLPPRGVRATEATRAGTPDGRTLRARSRCRGLGDAVGRRTTPLLADDGGVRRIPRAHRPLHRRTRAVPQRPWRVRQHGDHADLRQRFQRGGRARPGRSTRSGSSTTSPTPSRKGWPASTRSAARRCSTISPGAGRMRATPRSGAGSGRPTGAARPIRSSSPGRAASPRAANCARTTPTSSTWCRRCSTPCTSIRRRPSPASPSHRSKGSASRTPSTTMPRPQSI